MHHFGIDIEHDILIQRIRKQVMLEFAVAENGIIHLDGHDYNKNDLLAELDRSDFLDRWNFHKTIWEFPQILQFLEDDYVDLDTISSELNIFRNNAEFIEFISPYFSFSFLNMTRSLLNPPQLATLGILLYYQDFIAARHLDYAFSSIGRFLADQSKLFNNISKETYHLHSKDITHWTNGNWGEFLNRVPDMYYSSKEDIVVSLINLTVALQTNFPKITKAISSQLIRVKNIDRSHYKLIHDNHKIYMDNNKSYWWVFWVVFILAKIVAGC